MQTVLRFSNTDLEVSANLGLATRHPSECGELWVIYTKTEALPQFKKKTKTLKDIHIKLQTESNCFDKPLSAVMKFDHKHNRLKSSKSSVIFTGCRSAQLDGSRVDLQRG